MHWFIQEDERSAAGLTRLGIADRCGLVTCLDGKPIGFVTWIRGTGRNMSRSAIMGSGRRTRAGATGACSWRRLCAGSGNMKS